MIGHTDKQKLRDYYSIFDYIDSALQVDPQGKDFNALKIWIPTSRFHIGLMLTVTINTFTSKFNYGTHRVSNANGFYLCAIASPVNS